MRINQAGLDLIKRFEGLELQSYVDPVGILTIGYGHTGPDVREGQRITRSQAEGLLQQDVRRFEEAVNRLVNIGIHENEFAALVSLCYNIGEGAFARSTALALLNQNNRLGCANSIEWWNKGRINGHLQELPGLVIRRAAERGLFLTAPANSRPARPTEVPVEESTRILPSEENSGRRNDLSQSRTITGAGTAGAVGGAAATATAVEKMSENSETISPQLERLNYLFSYIPDWSFTAAAVIVVLAALYVIYARVDDWREHRR